MDTLTIDRNANWRLWHAHPVPKTWEVLGTVTRNGYDTGALARTPAGAYVQLNAGAARALDPVAVARALAA